jgi:capsular exopolysaccharide synthesis family protein
MEIKTYIDILIRRKFIIIITLVVTLILVAVGTSLQTTVYESSVTLRVAVSAMGSQSYYSTSYTDQLLNTMIQIATSTPVLDTLKEQLDLTTAPDVSAKIITNTELIKITVEDPNPSVAAEAADAISGILISRSNEVSTGGGLAPQAALAVQLSQLENDLLEMRKEYDVALQRTPAAPEADMLNQAMMLKQSLYYSLQQQYQDSLFQREMRDNMITIIEKPVIAKGPSKPKVLMNLLLGLVAGSLGGVALAFVRENLDPNLYNSQQIEELSELQTISRIPKAKKSSVITARDENPLFADAFRELSSKIQKINRKNSLKLKVILVSSAQPRQGKSTVATHLALHLAESGKKVLAVDCDLHLPTLHTRFHLPNRVGLTDILTNKANLTEALQQYEDEGLYVITSGEVAERPIILLDSPGMQQFLKEARRNFDYVILDSPAMLAVRDVIVISEVADVLLLVARLGKTDRKALQASAPFVKGFNGKVIGLILNEDKRFNGYGHYYHRRSYTRDLEPDLLSTVKQSERPQKMDVEEETHSVTADYDLDQYGDPFRP